MTVLIGCAFWIIAAWPAGAGAVVIASIICALFSNMDDPAPTAWKVWQGTCAAVVVAAVYAFAILPRVTDFAVLIAVMAPAFLTIGTMMVNRRTAAIAIGMILALPGLMGLDAVYSSSFTFFANAAIAQVVGALLAVLVLEAVRTIGAEKASLRLMRAGWRDLAGRAGLRHMPDTAKWINTMLDRIGLLTPRLIEIGGDTSTPLLEILRDTRVGISLDELQRLRRIASPKDARLLSLVLGRVRQHYARKSTAADRTDDALVRTIDLAMSKFSGNGVGEKRRATLALTSLRRNVVS